MLSQKEGEENPVKNKDLHSQLFIATLITYGCYCKI